MAWIQSEPHPSTKRACRSARGLTRIPVVLPTEDSLFDAARQAASRLRTAGLRTTTPLEVRKLGKEIGRADKAGARAVVIIGPEDWASEMVTVRNMTSGVQQKTTLEDLVGNVRAITQ